MTYQDGSTTSYTWDTGNRVTQIADSVGGTITRTYDGLDRLTSETTPEGSVSYTYDAAGRRTSLTVAGQAATTYAYDNADRLTTITRGASVVTFGYDTANRRTSLTLPSGVMTSYAYDAASRLTGLNYAMGTTTLGTLLYDYDAGGNRTLVGGTWARTALPQLLASATYQQDRSRHSQRARVDERSTTTASSNDQQTGYDVPRDPRIGKSNVQEMKTDLVEEFLGSLMDLRGKSCWSFYAGPSTGSNVDFDFGRKLPRTVPLLGNPNLTDDQKFYAGEMSLFVQCGWRLDSSREVICGSTDSSEKDGPLLLGLQAMVGTMVERVNVAGPAFDLVLSLSGDLFLKVFCDQTSLEEGDANYSLHMRQRIYIVGPRGRVHCETPSGQPPHL